MNNLIQLPVHKYNGVLVMSSIDLAELCVPKVNKDGLFNQFPHKDFLKRVKAVLGKGVGKFSNTSKDLYGKDMTILLLPEREAVIVAMSYSQGLRTKVYNAFLHEKVKATCNIDFCNPIEAARAWADQYEKTVELESRLSMPQKDFEYSQREPIMNGYRLQIREDDTKVLPYSVWLDGELIAAFAQYQYAAKFCHRTNTELPASEVSDEYANQR